jgi:hypothetical protein
MGWGDVDTIHLAQDGCHSMIHVNTVMNLLCLLKCWEIVE